MREHNCPRGMVLAGHSGVGSFLVDCFACCHALLHLYLSTSGAAETMTAKIINVRVIDPRQDSQGNDWLILAVGRERACFEQGFERSVKS